MSKKKEDLEDLLKGKEEVSSRSRVDQTLKIEPEERRMDTLAMLLSGRSNCVATIVINNKFYIAANEFFVRTTERNEAKSSMHRFLDYFHILAQTKTLNATESNAIFKEICNKRNIGKEIAITEDLPVFVEFSKHLFEGKRPKVTELRKLYRKDQGIAGFMWGEFLHLYNGLKKLEDSINSEVKIKEEHLIAFRQKAEILKLETEMGVHAEAQILGFIVKLIEQEGINTKEKQEFYIGISKLCCLHCRALFPQATYKLSILVINVLRIYILDSHFRAMTLVLSAYYTASLHYALSSILCFCHHIILS